MPFNASAFKTRSLTAIVFVLVMMAGLLLGQVAFVLLFLLIHTGCWLEFLSLMKKTYKEKYLTYAFGGLVYITLPILLLIDLRIQGIPTVMEENKYLLPMIVVLCMWVNDTMAYITGSLIGKTPLTKISPKKTWEGTVGGIALCVMVMGFAAIKVTSNSYPIKEYHWLAIAAIGAIAGTLGDLLESKIKRNANVKDSGSIMPGHGGFLDRFDSLLIAVPFVWLYIKLVVA